jgi:hypothetical protein
MRAITTWRTKDNAFANPKKKERMSVERRI